MQPSTKLSKAVSHNDRFRHVHKLLPEVVLVLFLWCVVQDEFYYCSVQLAVVAEKSVCGDIPAGADVVHCCNKSFVVVTNSSI